MNGAKEQPVIGLIGNLGNGNLGDEAILESFIVAVKQRYPKAAFIAFTNNFADTVERHGIEAAPARPGVSPVVQTRSASSANATYEAGKTKTESKTKAVLRALPFARLLARWVRQCLSAGQFVINEARFLLPSVRHLRRTHLMVVAGSGQIEDEYGGPFNYPYRLFKWSLLSRCLGKKFLVINVGAVPLQSAISRGLIRWTLRLAHYKSFRDEYSETLMRRLGVSHSDGVYPDLAFGLSPHPRAREQATASSALVVGVNVFPHRDPSFAPDADLKSYRRYLSLTAEYIKWITAQGHKVLMFPTQFRADVRVVQELLDLLGPDTTREQVSWENVTSLQGLFGVLEKTDIVAATRFHAVVLSIVANRPVLALANQAKVVDLMTDSQLQDYLLQVENADLEGITGAISRVLERRDAIKEHYKTIVNQHQESLHRQFTQDLCPIIESACVADPKLARDRG